MVQTLGGPVQTIFLMMAQATEIVKACQTWHYLYHTVSRTTLREKQSPQQRRRDFAELQLRPISGGWHRVEIFSSAHHTVSG